MISLKLPRNGLLMTLSLLSFTASQASNQDLFQEHAHSARASAIDYEWDTAKIVMTVGAAGAITYGIGPRVLQVSNWAWDQTKKAAGWAYERSEVAPLSKLAYAKTQWLRDKLPEVPPLFAPTSSLSMPLSEALPSSMDVFHCHILETLDHVLSQGNTSSKKLSPTGWVKKPLYGTFPNAQGSMVDHLNCCCKNQEYLMGYHYESPRYVVKIKKFFNKEENPSDIKCDEGFYKIHRTFKEKSKGKFLGEPQHYTAEEQHKHANSKNKSSVEDIAPFVNTFIKANHSARKELRMLFEEFLSLLAQNSNLASSSSHQSTEGQIELLIESGASSESQGLSIKKHKKSFEIYLATDEDTNKKHVYFLFPTKDSENHNILLHFKDKVHYDSTFLFESSLEESDHEDNSTSKGKEKEA